MSLDSKAKFIPKPKNYRVLSMKDHDTESKVFSKSTKNNIPGILNNSAFTNESYIKRMLSPIYVCHKTSLNFVY